MDDHHDLDIEAWRRVHRRLTLALIQSRDNIAAELTKRRYLLEEMNRCKMLNNNGSTYPKLTTTGTTASGITKPKKTIPASKKEKVKVVAPVPAPKPKKSKPPAAATVGDYIKVAEKMSPSMKDLTKIVVPVKAKPSKVKGAQAKKDRKVKEPPVGAGTTTTTPTSSLSPNNIMAAGSVVGASTSSESYNEQSNTARNVNADAINGGELLMSNLRFAGMTSSQPLGFYTPAAAAQYGLYGDMTTLGRTGLGMATPEQMGLAFHLLQQMNQNNNNAASNDGDSRNIRDG